MARISPQAVADFLGQTLLFRECPKDIIGKLAPHIELQTFETRKMIIPPGTVVSTLNFLYTGKASLQLVDGASGSRTLLEEVHPGDTFGEIGLILGAASPVVVVAEDTCEALLIQKAHFDKVAQVVPLLSRALAQRIANRFVKLSMLGSKRMPSVPAEPVPAAAPQGTDAGTFKGIRYVEVGQYTITEQILDFIPQRVMLEHRLLPLELRGRTLVVGLVNPTSSAAKTELRRVLHSVDPEIVAISADDFSQAVIRHKIDVRDKSPQGQNVSRNLKPIYQVEIKKEAEKQVQFIGDEAVSLLDRILVEAVERNVSDIHIEPDATSVRIRFRQGGMLHERKEVIPANLATTLIARIKVLSELDITDRRLPQDGRMVARLGNRELSVRVAVMPVARGEKAVLRLLDPADIMRPLEQIFVDGRALEISSKALGQPHGIVLVCGTSGSGKTSTLYSLINQRRKLRPDNNIVTVEDPIEYFLPGITQSAVNSRQGLEYSDALRALLRQDPDVIMIGEVRDADTARVVMEASATGQLVFAAAHSNDVASAFQRFAHFGIQTTQLAQGTQLLMVQKLLRKLCNMCVREEEVAPQLVESLMRRGLLVKGSSTRMPRPGQCEACGMTGYRGRVPAVEVLAIDEAVRSHLVAATPISEVLTHAQAGGQFLTFASCARMLMARKLITPVEALSATD